jgi:hypothetical protein
MVNIQGVQRGRRSRPCANAEAKMKNRWSQIISETLGAAAGTTLATLAFGYGVFLLVINSLEVVIY